MLPNINLFVIDENVGIFGSVKIAEVGKLKASFGFVVSYE